MTYTILDRSQEKGQPVELYEFDFGGAQPYRYTNADTDIPGPGGNYRAIPIQRTNIKTNGKFEKTNMEIRLPVDSEISEMFLPFPPPQVVKLYVRQKHLTDPDGQAPIVWFGRVISSGREGRTAILTADNAILSWKRQGLNRNWQPGCPLLLYGPRCRADAQDHRVDFSIVDIDTEGHVIFPADWNGQWAPEKFIRGTIVWNSQYGTESRTIIKASATTVRFVGFTRDLEAGTPVTLYLGCKHDMDDCRETFDNIANYGGQSWIPFKNPTKQHPFW